MSAWFFNQCIKEQVLPPLAVDKANFSSSWIIGVFLEIFTCNLGNYKFGKNALEFI